jgi:hypothetical protein
VEFTVWWVSHLYKEELLWERTNAIAISDPKSRTSGA